MKRMGTTVACKRQSGSGVAGVELDHLTEVLPSGAPSAQAGKGEPPPSPGQSTASTLTT